MNIGIGRRRLVIDFIVEQASSLSDHFPAAQAATDDELARIDAQRLARFDRTRWTSNAALYGVGYPR